MPATFQRSYRIEKDLFFNNTKVDYLTIVYWNLFVIWNLLFVILYKRMQKGYIATLTVLIIMAVVMATATTVTYLSIGEAQSGFALFKGEDTLSFVEGCVEDALLKIRTDSSLSGTFTIGRPPGEETCSITVVSKVINTWIVDVTTQATAYKRTVRVIFDRLSTGITLTSWREI